MAASEELRNSLALALEDSPEFEVVGVAATSAAVPSSTEVILVARTKDSRVFPAQLREDVVNETVLTNREREILALLADGLANKQIAARLGISANTVKTHVELLFEKLGVSSRAEAVATGVRRGMLLL